MATIRKKIEITADKVILPPGQNVKHVSTSIQIATDVKFEDKDIVHQRLKDQNSLYKYIVELELDTTKAYYARVRYHYTINGAAKDGSWTRAVLLDQVPGSVNMSAYIVSTPKVFTNYLASLNQLDIQTSDFNMFAGVALHASSNFKITDSDNNNVFVRMNDQDNLLSLQVMDKIQPNKLYSIQAAHVDDLGNSSFFGRNLLFNYSRSSELYTFEIAESLVQARKLYFKLNIFTPKYKSYDMEIRDTDGVVIIKVHDENKWTKETISYLDLSDPTIFQDGRTFEITKEYVIYIKLHFNNNTETKFEEVYRGRMDFNKLTNYKPLVKYSNRRVKGNDIMTDGISCVSTRELFDGKIINTLFKDNKLGLFTNDIGKHVKIKDIFDFNTIKLGIGFEEGDTLQVDYINIWQLPTHDILIDVCLYNGNNQSKTAFLLFEYDPFRMALSKDYIILPRDREMYNTSPCGSLVVLTNNDVYYVPSYIKSDADNTRGELVMYKWNVKENFFVKKPDTDTEENGMEFGTYVYNLNPTTIKLPFSAKANVSVVADNNNNIYILGGSVTPRYTNDKREEYWNRDNNNIYKLNKSNNTWDRVAEFPGSWSKDIYAMQAILRINGEIAIYNSSITGPAMPIQDIMLFNPKDNSISKLNTDHSWNIPFRSNIVYANGNVERISNKEQDPQKSVIFVANTHPAGSVDVDGNIQESDKLVVEDGEIVNIEDIYKYRTITIKGTGILRWYRKQGITDIDSKCLIINKDVILEDTDLTNKQYQSILILDKRDITIQG